jgi:YD repeat-containing protein
MQKSRYLYCTQNDRKTTYSYDTLNRRTTENWIGSAGQSLRSISYSYDAVGNLLTTIGPDYSYTYSYDALDRLATVDNTGSNGVPEVVLSYSYDAGGRLVIPNCVRSRNIATYVTIGQ